MAGDARVVWMPGEVRTELHLLGEDTGGQFCLLVDQPPPGWFLPAHRHAHEAETIHVVEGDFEMELAGSRTQLSAGETLQIPKGVVHSGANVGRQTGRRIIIFSPAGMENFFLEVGLPVPQARVDLAAALAAATRHGWEFVAQD